MMRNLCLFCFILLLSSCASKGVYSWYGYEKDSYKYFRDRSPESLENLKDTYEYILYKQKGLRGIPPPGAYAERGFIALKEGFRDIGIHYFEREIETYPESKVFLTSLIDRLEKQDQ